MSNNKTAMEHDKKIALVAHDNKKRDLLEWAKYNRDLLAHHKVYATGTTGRMLEPELGFEIHRLQSGPLGGDQQIGAKIVDGEIDFLIFFWDRFSRCPMIPMSKRSCVWLWCGISRSPVIGASRGFHDFLPIDGWRI